MFEASSKESILNLMRDMQGPYSRYLNKKYPKEPWRLLGVLRGRGRGKKFSKYLRMGPVNWSPRFDAVQLNAAGLREFMRYAELNPVRAGLVKRAQRWRCSSVAAHFAGSDAEGLLCLEQWQHFFGNPETADWAGLCQGADCGGGGESGAAAGSASERAVQPATLLGGACAGGGH